MCPFDLHVSCTPPALILSQDQTLRRLRSLRCDFIRGFDHSHIHHGFSCHSSVVKVQRPGQDKPRRRPTMMGRRRRGVKPGDLPVRRSGPGVPHPFGGGNEGEY
jgi:hypothetical protein